MISLRPGGPVCGLILTVWAFVSGQYTPVWQSPVLTGPRMPSGTGQIRALVSKTLGLQPGETFADDPIPPSCIATVFVHKKHPAVSRLPVKPLALDKVECSYAYLSNVDLLDERPPEGLEPARLSFKDAAVLLPRLALVAWDPHQKVPVCLLGRGSTSTSLFSRATLSRVPGLLQADEDDPYKATISRFAAPSWGKTVRRVDPTKPGALEKLYELHEKSPIPYGTAHPRVSFTDIITFATRLVNQAPEEIKAQAPRPGARLLDLCERYGVRPPENEQDVKRAATEVMAHYRAEQVAAKALPNSFFRDRARPRKSRKARRNPLAETDIETAQEYLKQKGRKTTADDSEIRRALRQVGEVVYTPESVNALFPREWAGAQTFLPSQRLPELRRVDVVSRVGSVDPKLLAEGQDLWDTDDPYSQQKAVALLAEESGLSLEDAAQILATQAGTSRRSNGRAFTIPASSALMKSARKRKLPGYTPPNKVMTAVGDGILIWLSPTGLQKPRVMTYRRGSHLDADLVGDRPGDVAKLLGKAIQASLLWIAAKPGRQAGNKKRSPVRLWIGRAGQAYVTEALSEKEPLSVQTVMRNLVSPERRIQFTNSTTERDNDAIAYSAALKGIGPRMAAPAERPSRTLTRTLAEKHPAGPVSEPLHEREIGQGLDVPPAEPTPEPTPEPKQAEGALFAVPPPLEDIPWSED